MKEKIKRVIVLGSSALKIGEAGEFDYSGSQAIKALKEERIFTILINPNIATIQTSEGLADKIYFLPVNADFVEKVIEETRPDGILLSFGGQTALNTGVELYKRGVLEKYNVKVLGSPIETIIDTEDRDRFKRKLSEIGVKFPKSVAVETVEDSIRVAKDIGFPVMMRVAYALGGLGSGICRSVEELQEQVTKALKYTTQVLIEEYLEGWKEVEYEVMCDYAGDCITICNMENVDPMGIHTGESIVVAPSQTLTNRDYHLLREISIRVIRHLGVIGECNIQFAYSPDSEDYRVIEVNARLSRSSALASKATGYPIAFIAAKLALGYRLRELPNNITKVTSAFFEPSLDYIVVKIPRWDLKKFRMVSRKIGSQMKSVGEVMAIGRKFEEAIQKGLRMLQTGANGLVCNDNMEFDNIEKVLAEPTEERIFAVAEAIKRGFSTEKISRLTKIDKWFIEKIRNIVNIEQDLKKAGSNVTDQQIKVAKKHGFSDKQISYCTGLSEEEIREKRYKSGIVPLIRQIDTLAGEFPAKTNYLYLTYNSICDDISSHVNNAVIVLGSGAYHIGSSVEFDWCCVSAVRTLRNLGYRTIMLNYNPETVSTDYDESDFLIFDEINHEVVYDVYKKMNPLGVIISFGGQVPNNIAMKIHKMGVRVFGTAPENIDKAENRKKFSDLLDSLGVDQPIWKELTSIDEAKKFAHEYGYPVLIRPSYVLSGSAMAVASNDDEMVHYLSRAVKISPEYPTVISKFYENAKEIEIDGVAQHGRIVIYAISEHVENAGVHSGDATLVFPPQRIYLETIKRVRLISKKIAEALNINGPFNIQFIAKNNEVKVIECNLRASRSFPFVSKVTKKNFAEVATKVIMHVPVEGYHKSPLEINYVGVKAPQFSFNRLTGADPVLGVEMSSTGEVGCLGEDFEEALLKSMYSVGYKNSIKSVLLSTGPIESKVEMLEVIRKLLDMGVKIYATKGTARFLKQNGIPVEVLFWPLEKRSPNAIEYIVNGKIDLVINIPKNYQKEELTNDYLIRRSAVDYNVMLITNRQIATRFIESISRKRDDNLLIKAWDEYKF